MLRNHLPEDAGRGLRALRRRPAAGLAAYLDRAAHDDQVDSGRARPRRDRRPRAAAKSPREAGKHGVQMMLGWAVNQAAQARSSVPSPRIKTFIVADYSMVDGPMPVCAALRPFPEALAGLTDPVAG